MTPEQHLNRIPYAAFLGLKALDAPDGLSVAMPFTDHLIGNPFLPALHGGATAAMLEITAIVQMAATHPQPDLPRPINVTVTYLRPGRPLDLLARATISKAGRRVAHVTAAAWHQDPSRPVATLSAHFLFAASL